jgi:hypothetical protein
MPPKRDANVGLSSLTSTGKTSKDSDDLTDHSVGGREELIAKNLLTKLRLTTFNPDESVESFVEKFEREVAEDDRDDMIKSVLPGDVKEELAHFGIETKYNAIVEYLRQAYEDPLRSYVAFKSRKQFPEEPVRTYMNAMVKLAKGIPNFEKSEYFKNFCIAGMLPDLRQEVMTTVTIESSERYGQTLRTEGVLRSL